MARDVRIAVGIETTGESSLTRLQVAAKKTGDTFQKEFGGDVKKAAKQAEESTKDIERAFRALGVKSTDAHRTQVQALVNAYNTLRTSGKASTTDLARAQDALRTRVAKLKGEYKATGQAGVTAMRSTAASASRLSQVIQTLGGTAVLYRLRQGLQSAVTGFADFDDKIRSAGAVMNASQEEMQKLSEEAKRLGRETRYTAADAALGFDQLGRAGLDATKALGTLPNTLQLAAAGGLELGQAADITTNIMSGFGQTVEDLAHTNDVLVKTFTTSQSDLIMIGEAMKYVAPLANGVKASFEETAAAIGMLHNAGIKADMAGTALRGMLDRLYNPTDAVRGVLAKLEERMGGVKFQLEDSQGKFIGYANVLKQLEKGGLTAAEAMKLFGLRAGPAVLALLTQGSEAMEKYTAVLENSGGTAERIADQMEAGLGGALRELKSAVEGLGISLGEDLEPIIRTLASGIKELATGFSELPDGVRYATEAVLGLAAGFLALKTAMAGIGLLTAASNMGTLATGAGAAAASTSLLGAAVGGLSAILAGPGGLVVAAAAGGLALYELIKVIRETEKAIEEGYQAEKDGYELASRNALQTAKNLRAYNQVRGTAIRMDERGNIILDEQTKKLIENRSAIDKLKNAAKIPVNQVIKMQLEGEDAAKEKIKDLTKPEKKYIEIVTVESGSDLSKQLSSGAPKRDFIYMENTPGFASGGFVRRYNLLPGYGGGDRIRALLEQGEYIMDKRTVRRFGPQFFERLQKLAGSAGRFRPSLPQVPASPIPSFSGGGMVSAPSLPNLGTINLNLGGGEVATVYGDDRAVAAIKRAVSLEQRRRSSS